MNRLSWILIAAVSILAAFFVVRKENVSREQISPALDAAAAGATSSSADEAAAFSGETGKTTSPTSPDPETTGSPAASAPARSDPAKTADNLATGAIEETAATGQAAKKAALISTARKNKWLVKESVSNRVVELIDVRDGRPVYYETKNVNAAISTAADLVRETAPYGLTGTGVAVGVWDGGHARATHQEYGDRVSTNDVSSVENHATHVTGTICASGKVASARGMAPEVVVESRDWASDTSEMTDRGMSSSDETNKLQISNHSYGFVGGWSSGSYSGSSGPHWFGVWGDREDERFGQYSIDSREWDGVLYNAPYFLTFKSAGNDRNDGAPSSGTTFYYIDGIWRSTNYNASIHPYGDGWDAGGYDTVGTQGTAKNLITVGAVNDAVTAGVRDISKATMSSFSCWGPADDGRIKPDIVANGVGLYSTVGSSDTAYQGGWNGTSMSSPNAAGSAALLVEHYGNLFPGQAMRSSTLKALILHTADDIGNAGPDYANGWGLMNTKAAADRITSHLSRTNAHRLVESLLTTNLLTNTYSVITDGSTNLRVTICWTDPPGDAKNTLDDRTSVLVNDLDLRVISPDGTTNFPFLLSATNPTASATTGDNDIDNVEQVLTSDTTNGGVYEVLVYVDGSVTSNQQFYSMIISGSALPPEINFTPIGNSTNTVTNYVIAAEITAETGVNTNGPFVLWNTNGSTSAFSTNLLTWVTDSAYEGFIPSQPVGTVVSYYLLASASNGLSAVDPTGSPDNLHSFEVRPPVTLSVTGMPIEVGIVTPDYGDHVYPSGETINASAELFTTPSNGFRYAVTGWTGTGSVPTSGSSNSFSLMLSLTSSVTWQWTTQIALVQTSSVAGVISTTTWWNAGTTGATSAAEESIMLASTQFMFASWYVDSLRQPDASNTAVNPATELIMNTQRFASALYLPIVQDEDGDGLSDWWEIFHFGSTNAAATNDSDADGFNNSIEHDDDTDPKDTNSFPTPPAITHTPLDDPQSSPAPWPVSAVVSDNYHVASVTLWWNRNAGGWQSTSMVHSGGGTYTASIPSPGTNADSFAYEVVAEDSAGLSSTNGSHTFDVAYPIVGVSPTDLGHHIMLPDTSTNLTLTITNAGTAALTWDIILYGMGLDDDIENGTNAWFHHGTNDLWHISTSRYYSASHSWYAGIDSLGSYGNSMHAMLLTPVVHLGSNAVLSFRHWLEAEIYIGNYTWDGAMVELSTNAGTSYFQITPVGGYPRQIYGHPASPWPEGTPCFADTGGWDYAEFDLSAYEGHDAVVRFHFGSDGAATEEGWYIDDVVVSPQLGTNDWLLFSAISGTVSEASASNITVFVNSTGVPTGEDRGAQILITSNDEQTPTSNVPVLLSVRTPPEASAVSAIQSSTNGEGFVIVSNTVYDADGETVSLEMVFSTNQGLSWATGWMFGAQADTGTPAASNNAPKQVYSIITESAGEPISNNASVMWGTTNELLAVTINTSVLVRVRPWDPYYSGNFVTSTPFMVDNESPAPPDSLASSSHTQMEWSTRSVATSSWTTADDGDGGGIGGYAFSFSNTPTIGSDAARTAGLTANSPELSDGTTWWFNVKSLDVYGNESGVTNLGAFWIDTTPPLTGTVVLQTSDLGDYTIGSSVTGRWSGFTDALSGVAAYYVSWTNNAPTTNGNWTIGTNSILESAVLDETNHFFVWSRDVAGNIGTSAFRAILALNPSGDFDGDGMNNRNEETAGTALGDSNSLFRSEDASPAVTNREPPTISWPYATNREYIVFRSEAHVYADDLVWTAITNPAYTVTNNRAVWVDTNGLDTGPGTGRFYRVGANTQ